MASKLSGIELTRYDDLFKTDAEREADRQERIQLVPAAEVFPYSRQPYTIDRPTPDLVRLMDSIEHIGIAEPLIVRPRESSGYEIISGHRRDYCAKAVGLDTRPVIVRNYSDEEADILVVDYNINREDLLPSEKAKAYKLKLDAMKRQGQRTDLTSAQVGQKLLSVEKVADDAGESRNQIKRYIRLTYLILGTSIMTLTTTPIALTDGLERLLMPLSKIHFPAHELAMMMTIALRFIPTLIEEADKIMKAQMARGADFESGNLIKRAKNMIPILVPLFVSAFRRADELAMAMESRCYHGGEGRTRMNVLKFGRGDGAAAAAFIVLTALTIAAQKLLP